MTKLPPFHARVLFLAALITVFVSAAAAAQSATVTITAPQTAAAAVGQDAKVVVSATTSVPGSQPLLSYTPLMWNMQIRQLTSGQTSTWQLSWTPRPGQYGGVICFQATDQVTGEFSFGSTCTAWQVPASSIIGLTGIVRTFAASHPDMNRPTNEAASPAQNFVMSTLGADNKPVFNAGAAPSITRFNEWFNTVAGANQASVYTPYFSNFQQFDSDVYSFASANWQPVDGTTFFTFEGHTAIIYSPGRQFVLKSSDDLWMFINHVLVPGSNLHGVHAERTLIVNLDTLGLTPGGSYPVDVFYAHRGGSTIPSIQVQLSPETPSIYTPVVTDIPVSGFSPDAMHVSGSAALSGGDLKLLPSTALGWVGGGAWLDSEFQLINGFQVEFEFVGSSPSSAEGFALVAANSPQGGAGGRGLGYDGITSSLAVEFDAGTQSDLADPPYQHISIHTRGADANSAAESASIGVQPFDINLPNNFFNATPQHVRVSYTPVSEQSFGWLRVWMNDNLLPSIETLLSHVDLAELLGDDKGFLGFTAGREIGTSALTIRSARVTSMVDFPPYPSEPLRLRFVEGRTPYQTITFQDPERDRPDAWLTGALPPGVWWAGGTTIRFFGAPDPGSRGSYPMMLHVSDIYNTVATPFVIVVNHPPVAVDDAIEGVGRQPIMFQPQVNDHDGDGDGLGVVSIEAQHGTVTDLLDGWKQYVADTGFAGIDTLTYTVSDGYETDTGMVTVTIAPIPPVALSPFADISISEDAGDVTLPIDPHFTDPDHGQLTFTAWTDVPWFTATAVSGQLLLHVNANTSGVAHVTVRATDPHSATVETTFTVTVSPVNDAPMLDTAFAALSLVEDAADAFVPLDGHFIDIDSSPLSFSVSSTSSIVTASIDGGQVRLHLAANESGAATVTVRATDPGALFSEASFAVAIAPVNDQPRLDLAFDAVSVNEDAPDVLVPLAGHFSDIDDSTLEFSVSSNTPNVSATVDGGQVRLHFTENYFGTAQVTIRATDGSGAMMDALLPVSVASVNDAPQLILAFDDVVAAEDAADILVSFANNFRDLETAALSFAASADAPLVTTSIEGRFVRLHLTPNAFGTGQVIVRATDAEGAFVEGKINIKVDAVNDPPTLDPIAPVTVNAGQSVTIALSNLTAGAGNESGQPLAVDAQSSDPAATGPITYSQGVLTLTPPPRSTTTTVTVTVTVRDLADSNSTVVRTFVLTITGVPTEPPPSQLEGRMHGQGGMTVAGIDYDFQFKIAEKQIGVERGSLDLKICAPKTTKKKESVDKFESTAINAIVFSDDPAFKSGRAKKAPLVDSAVFTGTGKWNGAAGYRFEAKATDQGEPGPGRDSFKITIYNASNVVVATVDAPIGNGNIQSNRLKN